MELEDLKLKYIIISRDKKIEKKCTLYPLRGREDFSFRTKMDIGNLSQDAILLFPNGEPLTPPLAGEIANNTKSTKLEIVLIDTRWRKTKGMLNMLPPLRNVSMVGYQTGAVRRDPPPEGGLASCEVLYLVSKIFGKPDPTLLENYHFRSRFFEVNDLK